MTEGDAAVPDDPNAVLAANRAFYEAFDAGDFERIDALWARDHEASVIHPGWAPIHGRDAVLESWKGILEGPSPPDIRCGDAHARIEGDLAIVMCVEHLGGGDLLATNVFVHEQGAWRMVHHHAAPAPPPMPEPQGPIH